MKAEIVSVAMSLSFKVWHRCQQNCIEAYCKLQEVDESLHFNCNLAQVGYLHCMQDSDCRFIICRIVLYKIGIVSYDSLIDPNTRLEMQYGRSIV